MSVLLGVFNFLLEVFIWNWTKITFKTTLGVISCFEEVLHEKTSSHYQFQLKTEQNCIQLHGILQIKLDTHWTPRKTLVLGRQPFQHIPSSWNHRVGCHDMSKINSENLKILFNPWIVSIFLISKVTSENLKIGFNRWIFNYFVTIIKVTGEHLNILFNPWIDCF